MTFKRFRVFPVFPHRLEAVLNTRFISASHSLLARLAQSAKHHPKRIVAAIASLLLTAGGGAFAVASLDQETENLPIHTVITPVNSLVQGSTLAQLTSDTRFSLYRSEYTRNTDTAASLLQRLGIADPQAVSFLRNNPQASENILGRTGRLVTAQASNDHQLEKLIVRWVVEGNNTDFQRLTLQRNAAGSFDVVIDSAPLEVRTRMAGGTIQSTLFAATDAAGIPDHIATQVADIFPEINFRRLFKGDRFTFVYETLEADGELLRSNRVLSAQFVNRGKTYEAMWFQEPGQRGAYYAMDGSSLRRAYLNAPLEFTRISSNFSNRFHPILKTWRKHLGTDYAAPTGTKVRTVGDGVVEFAGWQNGFGNVVYIKHTNASHVTVYGHLSRIDVQKGQRVEQGDGIGAVGSTGWSTGPHLHFEFRVNGVHQDPQSIVAENVNNPISEKVKAAFKVQADQMRDQLASADLIYNTTAQ